MMQPKFSILIAVYNAAKYLPQCLDSLLAQQGESFEILCTDDCSTDQSSEVLRQYAQRDPRIRLFRTPCNSGAAIARNLALRHARGEWTLMVDADDWISPNALRQLSNAIANNKETDCVLLRLVRVMPDGSTVQTDEPESPAHGWTGSEAALLAIDWRISGLYALRTTLHRQMPFDTSARIYSDDNTARLHLFRSRQVCRCEGIYYYRQHAASSTHAGGMQRLEFLRANIALRNLVHENKMGALAERICEEHCWRNFVGIWRQTCRARQRFTDEERRKAHYLLNESYQQMRPVLLPWSVRLRPSLLFLRPFALFAAWQRCYTTLRRWFHMPPLP